MNTVWIFFLANEARRLSTQIIFLMSFEHFMTKNMDTANGALAAEMFLFLFFTVAVLDTSGAQMSQ